jgi:hypothetical protein
MDDARRIVDVLDRCAANHVFPLLDHPYEFLAASRLSLYRSVEDWALVIETFSYNPRAGAPYVCVWTCASRLHARDPRDRYASEAAYANYLAFRPHDDVRFFHPCDGDWIGERERVSRTATQVRLRGRPVTLPARSAYAAQGIDLAERDDVRVYELTRWLGATHREDVLASADERRCSVRPEMAPLLALDGWHHPQILGRAEKPGGSETFRQLGEVLASGDVGLYRPTLPPNNHWRHWPQGGSL